MDADVDAADMHMLLQPEIRKTESFSGLDVADKNDEKCVGCGKCLEACRYGAFDDDFKLRKDRCEGCAVCTIVCPADALKMVKRVSGEAYVSDTRFGPMAHARMHPGEEASGKLVSLVRHRARELAAQAGGDLVIIDGPPGTGCTVIASLAGVKLILVVIEPTLSGIHDSKRVMEVAAHFGIKTLACINKFDVNEENTAGILEFCGENGVPVVGKIPYDETATKAMMAGKTVVEFSDGPMAAAIREIWDRVREEIA